MTLAQARIDPKKPFISDIALLSIKNAKDCYKHISEEVSPVLQILCLDLSPETKSMSFQCKSVPDRYVSIPNT